MAMGVDVTVHSQRFQGMFDYATVYMEMLWHSHDDSQHYTLHRKMSNSYHHSILDMLDTPAHRRNLTFPFYRAVTDIVLHAIS